MTPALHAARVLRGDFRPADTDSQLPPRATRDEVAPPRFSLFAVESRAFAEYALCLQAMPILRRAPRGDHHAVLVLPGFTASDLSTRLLRRYLKRLGYHSSGWGLGRNRGPSPRLEAAMTRKLRSLYWHSGGAVSIVGWSLGGIYARELARQHPEMVRQVVTLGSPFAAPPTSTNIWRLFELVSGQTLDELDPHLVEEMRRNPPVPATAIYSETDGVASWQACVERPGDTVENVRIPGSHCGLGHNPWALWVIADRLAQAEGEWSPFERRGLRELFYPEPTPR